MLGFLGHTMGGNTSSIFFMPKKPVDCGLSNSVVPVRARELSTRQDDSCVGRVCRCSGHGVSGFVSSNSSSFSFSIRKLTHFEVGICHRYNS